MRCLLGLHKWSAWFRSFTAPWSNALVRTCHRCGKDDVR